MGVHFETLSRSVPSLRTSTLPCLASLIHDSIPLIEADALSIPNIMSLAESLLEVALFTVVSGHTRGTPCAILSAALETEASAFHVATMGAYSLNHLPSILKLLLQCPELLIESHMGYVRLHPSFATRLAAGACMYAERVRAQLEHLWLCAGEAA